jgi:acetyltransferase-like isoleucine patch superfamily enzyme
MGARVLYGIDFPGKPRFEGHLVLKLNSSAKPSVIAGRDVNFLGDIDLRTRDQARLTLGDRVKLDGPVRIVAAGSRGIEIGDDTRITCYTIINGGGQIHIGRGVIIGPRTSINANEHRFRGATPIIETGFDHVDIWIGDDVWLGSDVAVLPGAHIADGTIVGANSVVNSVTEPRSIYVGSPARKVGERPG